MKYGGQGHQPCQFGLPGAIFLLYRPTITKVFVLVRSKKDKSGDERITEVLQTELFNKVREENPKSLEKVIPINGDVAYDELGLSKEDAAMLREDVSVVIHSAANVNFGASLHDVLKINVGGTKNMLDWAKQLKYLKAFVHISTAYSNSDRLDIAEKVYPNQISPHAALQLCSLLPTEILTSISPQLRRGNIMPYTFSKHLAEILVDESRFDIPVCIVRPAIVTAANKEPIPGWVDNLTGFNGMGSSRWLGPSQSTEWLLLTTG
ncbi:unnamed protein product [Allacma fusca]|uniref:Fatty acyl-CoA reductase n=1 Tax=Allacma fusca TaxID=39272 RepID=A0A8J2KJ85_9HEXA|nr:unnamed protein product [Allacma fusca]